MALMLLLNLYLHLQTQSHAHPDVFNMLLQILEDGVLTDSQGRKVSFKNAIIIMTSNAGSTDQNTMGFGKSTDDINREVTMKALERFLRPEFLGRVDEIVIFNKLTFDNFEKIAKIMLDELVPSLKDKGIDLVYEDSVPFLSAKKLLPEGSVVTLLSFFIFLLLSLCTLLIHHNLRLRFSLYKKLAYMYKKVLSSSYNNSNQK